MGPSYPEVTRAICLVPSTSFSQAPWYTQPAHLCRFGVRSIRRGYFPVLLQLPIQSNKDKQHSEDVTSGRSRNINLVPIDYGCRPRLRDRLTLRRLPLRRNPWAFGDKVSHLVCRYSCQHSHFRYLQQTSRFTFTDLRNAPLPRISYDMHPHLRCMALAPLHLRRRTAIRPVSYYAFFKGWLLLSQPPDCYGLPTSFNT